MRPVEPLTSWFRSIGLTGRDAKTMRAYAYTVLMLVQVAQHGGPFSAEALTELTEAASGLGALVESPSDRRFTVDHSAGLATIEQV
ncbi:hypothetical protein ACFT7S_17290 [Streptomyces sp. NPDC057136]|uniref:hypothetical protein n=1 Tax=Streptomyces sp. NPDC057136 TaxID=3346029 RepID=UPI0036304EB4